MTTPLAAQARAFAVAAHADQMYGQHPYVHHLDAVASIAEPFGETAVVAAYLHDTVEDTAATKQQIDELFGTVVAECVALLTDQAGADRAERKRKTYAKLGQVQGQLEVALIVKAADRLANVRACVQDRNERLLTVYRNEHAMFRQAAYRPGLCDAIWNELDVAIGPSAP